MDTSCNDIAISKKNVNMVETKYGIHDKNNKMRYEGCNKGPYHVYYVKTVDKNIDRHQFFIKFEDKTRKVY